MNPTLTGSGLVQAAMAQRMPGAPQPTSLNPQTVPQPPAPMPDRNPMAGLPSGSLPVPTPGAGPAGAVPETGNEMEKIIIQALIKKLERMGKTPEVG